jgi:hypothetical protein
MAEHRASLSARCSHMGYASILRYILRKGTMPLRFAPVIVREF